MRLFVGVTDGEWYRLLSESQPDEVNFWRPSPANFVALKRGELFLFKLHAPENAIVGGGYFVQYSALPLSLAWTAFGLKNGVEDPVQFKDRIIKYRRGAAESDPVIGAIVLTEPFWFAREDWIKTPDDFALNIVFGKGYDAFEANGFSLLKQVQERLAKQKAVPKLLISEGGRRFSEATGKIRLGQGGFRVVVTEAYKRKCAITGESTLPVLEAAHIRPYSADGAHALENGILLRSDMHILFDKGLLTVTPDYKLKVSPLIREQYANGKLYYSYEGEQLRSLPAEAKDKPNRELLEWHNQAVFQA